MPGERVFSAVLTPSSDAARSSVNEGWGVGGVAAIESCTKCGQTEWPRPYAWDRCPVWQGCGRGVHRADPNWSMCTCEVEFRLSRSLLKNACNTYSNFSTR
jgi:hypothetical protein